MANELTTTIDGWRCTESFPGTEWAMRSAARGDVEFSADANGLDVEESTGSYCGARGRYGLPANVLMWLVQACR